MPTLRVLQGPDKGRLYHALNEPAILGRGSDQIKLSDHTSSRKHAEIKPDNGVWILTDLGSSNGTYLNGQRIVSPSELKHGDQIKIGSTLLVFSGHDSEETFVGAEHIRNKVDVDYNPSGGSSILSSVDALGESVILPPPEAADAVVAWNVIYKVAEMIGSIDSVDTFLERVCDAVFDNLVVDRLALLVRSGSGDELTPQVVRFRPAKRGRRRKLVTSQSIVDHVLDTKEGVLCANALTDERFGRGTQPDSIHRLGLCSIICVPILVRGHIHGVFHLDCDMSRHTYTQEQLRLAVSIGRLAGVAIENMRLQESRVQTERLAAAGEAVAYLSHYIRNILQGLQGGVDVVDMALKRESISDVASGWGLVHRNLERISLLTMNMLTFSKERQPLIEMGLVNKIIEDVVELSQVRADEHSVMLLTDLEEMPPVPLDPDGIHQVVNNIVTNAIEAAPEKDGRVNISTTMRANEGVLVITVRDNGPGIPAEERERVFEAFQSSKGHGGTGLGLAAAKKIVAELRGTIVLESTVGEGTSFHITLPIHRDTIPGSDETHSPPHWA